MATLKEKVRARLFALGLLLVSCSSGDPMDNEASNEVSDEAVAENESATAQQDLSSSSNSTLATGKTHACKIIAGGKVVCWGDNQFGQLGNGTTMPQTGAVRVSGIT